MISESGTIFYQDEWGTFYDVTWETVLGNLDITTIIKQPFVWGEEAQGFRRGNILYRRGIITVQRQIIEIVDGGYIIIADGASQYIDFIQMNFPCGGGPEDLFAHHVDNYLSDEVEIIITDGPRWADPDNPDDADIIWSEVTAGGSPVVPATGSTALEWIDVWS